MTEGGTDPPTGERGLTEIPHPRACCCAHLPLTSLRQRQKKATPHQFFIPVFNIHLTSELKERAPFGANKKKKNVLQ